MTTRHKLLVALLPLSMAVGFCRGVILGVPLHGWQATLVRGIPYVLYGIFVVVVVPDNPTSHRRFRVGQRLRHNHWYGMVPPPDRRLDSLFLGTIVEINKTHDQALLADDNGYWKIERLSNDPRLFIEGEQPQPGGTP